jgi:hypothetical protein
MRYFACYQDDRDNDESAIFEGNSIDDCSDAVVKYFRNSPESLAHMKYWAIYDVSFANGESKCVVFQTQVTL